MSLDELQQTWQSQTGATLRIDADVLLAEIRRNQRSFKATLFWRDFREVLIALIMIPVFAKAALEQGWPWLSFSAACAWIAGFILIDRWWRRGQTPAVEQSLAVCVDESLREVEHQIWLLKNISWWYLLPGNLAAVFTFAYIGITEPTSWLTGWLFFVVGMGAFLALDVGIYWLNQWAIRTELEPRRQELLAIRESLTQPDE